MGNVHCDPILRAFIWNTFMGIKYVYNVCLHVWAGFPTCSWSLYSSEAGPRPLSVCMCADLCWWCVTETEALGNWVQLQSPPPKAIAHGRSYVFTELTPEPTCLDSYTTTKRLQEKKKKRQDKWKESERGGEECLSLENPSFQYLSSWKNVVLIQHSTYAFVNLGWIYHLVYFTSKCYRLTTQLERGRQKSTPSLPKQTHTLKRRIKWKPGFYIIMVVFNTILLRP